ncbi:DUF1294 domain-containing protein [uncultured Umboniibacter sp.]|uniref:DUF1294 domain-containing protein n=1 Tax=uncultured Umboniibacter sp. TaxID=1798917 RepID=UPI002629CED0|nr:DUF1294 domain-containing protein [uncultured Umboniibacter sp.]
MNKWLLLIISTAFLGVLLAAHLINLISPMVIAYILVMALIGYVVFYIDKRLAEQSEQRIPEHFLLLVAAAGGWIGASLAKVQLRHKTSKWSFQLAYYCAVLLNLILLYFVVWLF